MPSIRSILFHALPLATYCAAQDPTESQNDGGLERFQQLVDNLPRESLDAALKDHLAPKYRDGVFEDVPKGIHAVHSEDPELATRLADIAAQEAAVKDYLRKRQAGGNDTVTSDATSEVETTTSPIVVTDSSTSAISLTTETTTQQPSTSASPEPTTSDVPSTTQEQSTSQETTTEAPSTTEQPSTTEAQSTAESTSQGSSGGSTVDITTTDDSGNTGVTTAVASSTQEASSPITEATVTGESTAQSTGGGNSAQSTDDESSAQSTGGAAGDVQSTADSNSAQSTGGADSSAEGSQTIVTSQAPATQSGVLVPIVMSSTDADGNVDVRTTSAFRTAAPTSVDTTYATTDGQGSTFTTSSRVAAAVITSTNDNGDAVTTTSPLAQVEVASGGRIITSSPALGASTTDGPSTTRANNDNDGESSGSMSAYTTTDRYGNSVVLSGSTSGQVITTTDAQGRTVTLTYTPDANAVSQLVLETTSLANGQRSTITSFAVVGGAATITSQLPRPTPASTTGTPGLQSGLAAPTGRYAGEMAAFVGGAMGVAAIIL